MTQSISSSHVYRHVLVGLDLSDEAPLVLNKAAKIAHAFGAQLSVAHIIEPIAFVYGGDMPLDIPDTQEREAYKADQLLQKLVDDLNISVQQKHILVGQPAAELRFLAQQHNLDLIVVGSHGRKGFALLLGSTPNSVLHGASCDVLAIFVPQHAD
jgi:universal stress protein A